MAKGRARIPRILWLVGNSPAAHLGVARDTYLEFQERHPARRSNNMDSAPPPAVSRTPLGGLIPARRRAIRPASAFGIFLPLAEGFHKPVGGAAAKPGASLGVK